MREHSRNCELMGLMIVSWMLLFTLPTLLRKILYSGGDGCIRKSTSCIVRTVHMYVESRCVEQRWLDRRCILSEAKVALTRRKNEKGIAAQYLPASSVILVSASCFRTFHDVRCFSRRVFQISQRYTLRLNCSYALIAALLCNRTACTTEWRRVHL